MSDYLELNVDKFKFRIATDRVYTTGGVWAFWMQLEQENRVRVGVTDYLQQHSGDITFISVKPVGTKLSAGDDFAEFETIKTIIVLPSPVNGTISEINPAIEITPEIINQDPYDKGWLAIIEATNWEADLAKLIYPQAYLSIMQSEVEKELKNP
jgi:glycine cleavage system H protein